MKGLIASVVLLVALLLAAVAGVFTGAPGLMMGWLCLAPFAGVAVGWFLSKASKERRAALLNDNEYKALQKYRQTTSSVGR